MVSDMKKVKDLSLQELDQSFCAATGAARDEAVAHGLPVVGIDKDGNLIKLDADRTTLLMPGTERTKKYVNVKPHPKRALAVVRDYAPLLPLLGRTKWKWQVYAHGTNPNHK
jgi:hypothetical protein